MFKTDLNHNEYYSHNTELNTRKNQFHKTLYSLQKIQDSKKIIKKNKIIFNDTYLQKNLPTAKQFEIRNNKTTFKKRQKQKIQNSIEWILGEDILDKFKLCKPQYQEVSQAHSRKGKLSLKNLLLSGSCDLKYQKNHSKKYDEPGQYFVDSIKFTKSKFIEKQSRSKSKSSRSNKSRRSIKSPLRTIRKLKSFGQTRSPVSKIFQVVRKQEKKQKQKQKQLINTERQINKLKHYKSMESLNNIFRKNMEIDEKKNFNNFDQNNDQISEIIQPKSGKTFFKQILKKNQQQKRFHIEIKQILNEFQHKNHFKNKSNTNLNKSQQQDNYLEFDVVHKLLSNPNLSSENVSENKQITPQNSYRHPELKKNVSSELDYSDYGIENQESIISIKRDNLKNIKQCLKSSKIQTKKQNSSLIKSKVSISKVLSPKKSLSLSGSKKSLCLSSKKKQKQKKQQQKKLFHSEKLTPETLKEFHKYEQNYSINNKQIFESQNISAYQECSSFNSKRRNLLKQSQRLMKKNKKQYLTSQEYEIFSTDNLHLQSSQEMKIVKKSSLTQKNADNPSHYQQKIQSQIKDQMIHKRSINQQIPVIRILSLKNIQKTAKIQQIIQSNQASRQSLKNSSSYQDNQSQSIKKQQVQQSDSSSKLTSSAQKSYEISSNQKNSYSSSSSSNSIKKVQQICVPTLKNDTFSSENVLYSRRNTLNSSSQIDLNVESKTSFLKTISNYNKNLGKTNQSTVQRNFFTFKKKRNYAEYTLNEVARLIEQHEQRIQALCLYIDNCKSLYEGEYELQKYQSLCFLMLKKNLFELQRVTHALQLKQKFVFNLTDIQIQDDILEEFIDRQQIVKQLNNLRKQIKLRTKQFEQNYNCLQKKYRNEKGFNLSLEKDDFSSQIVKKLSEQLNVLYQKWEKNKSDGVTAIKLNKKFQKRMIEIIELIFLISELDGKKIKGCQLFTEKQEQFQTYYEKYFEKIIETIQYFDKKSRYSH